jgi:alpha-glucoside transport system substrate-binding protein
VIHAPEREEPRSLQTRIAHDRSPPMGFVSGSQGLVTVLAVVLISAGCSPARGGAAGDVQPLRDREVEVAAVWTGQEQADIERALVRFEQETGAIIRYTAIGHDIAGALERRRQQETLPDVVIVPGPMLLPDLAERGVIRPLGDSVQQLVDENFAPAWRDLGSVDGRLFGVWVRAVNKSTLLYDPSVLREAGVQPPTTWRELLRCARSIAASGNTPLSFAGGDGWPLTDWFENVYLRLAGSEKYDQLARRRLAWTDQSVKQALSLLSHLWNDRALIAKGSPTRHLRESIAAVISDQGATAIAYDGGFVSGGNPAVPPVPEGTDGAVLQFPSVAASPKVVVGTGDVAVRLADEPAASALMEFLAGPKAGDVLVEGGGFGRVAGGISAPGSHRSRRDSLPSPGSSHPPGVPYERTHFQWANRPGCRSSSPAHHLLNRPWARRRRYFFPAHRLR